MAMQSLIRSRLNKLVSRVTSTNARPYEVVAAAMTRPRRLSRSRAQAVARSLIQSAEVYCAVAVGV